MREKEGEILSMRGQNKGQVTVFIIIAVIIVAAAVLYFVFVTIQTNFMAVFILPALLLLTYFALRHNRKIEKKESILISFNRKIKLVNYLLLLFIPIVALGLLIFLIKNRKRWKSQMNIISAMKIRKKISISKII